MRQPAVLARVTRSGLEESVHLGHVAVCDATGRLVAATGDSDHEVFARSTMKPVQAAVSLRESGEDLSDEDLAVMSASHNGEPIHVTAVSRLLDRAGLGVSALRCPAAWPWFPEDAADAERPSPEYHNCSGKHAGMVLASSRRGYPVATYLEPDHPLQLAALEAVRSLAAVEDVVVGVDGCGVPVHGMSLHSLATIFARLAAPSAAGSLEGEVTRVTSAMQAKPYLVAGRDRAETALMEAVNVVAKVGAEGLMCAAVAEAGLGVAVKVSDGSMRASGPALILCCISSKLSGPNPSSLSTGSPAPRSSAGPNRSAL